MVAHATGPGGFNLDPPDGMDEELIKQTNAFMKKNKKLIELLNATVTEYGKAGDAMSLIVLSQCLTKIAAGIFQLECVKDVMNSGPLH